MLSCLIHVWGANRTGCSSRDRWKKEKKGDHPGQERENVNLTGWALCRFRLLEPDRQTSSGLGAKFPPNLVAAFCTCIVDVALPSFPCHCEIWLPAPLPPANSPVSLSSFLLSLPILGGLSALSHPFLPVFRHGQRRRVRNRGP